MEPHLAASFRTGAILLDSSTEHALLIPEEECHNSLMVLCPAGLSREQVCWRRIEKGDNAILAEYKTCTMKSRRMAGGSIYHPASGPTVAATLCMGDKLQASDVCMLTTICNLLLMDRLKLVQDRHGAMPTQHTAHSTQLTEPHCP
jgi:hypothetical protein